MIEDEGLADDDFFDDIEESSVSIRKEVIKNLKDSALEPIPVVESLVEDVYEQVPPVLQNQLRDLEENMREFPQFYPEKYRMRD